jgi:hypothetical protein
VPIGYAAFAFSLGALTGAIVRRLLPAMAVSLAGFVAVRLAVTAWVRPHLISARHALSSLTSPPLFEIRGTVHGPVPTAMTVPAPDMPNAWIQSAKLVTSGGHAPTLAQESAFVRQYCLPITHSVQPASGAGGGSPQGSGIPTALTTCQAQAEHLFRVAVSYQPPSRYWIFNGASWGSSWRWPSWPASAVTGGSPDERADPVSPLGRRLSRASTAPGRNSHADRRQSGLGRGGSLAGTRTRRG